MVYFKDKGITVQTSLQKTSQAYAEAVQSLSERSIQRRIKHRGAENFILNSNNNFHYIIL
ncbi:MAG: hypothetical protein COZ25_03060 [Ignavibacteria bacterium CG_4_10_14_3_um_filter_37_18]|nr:MAG: hypothetical protein COZ25_03060 [Ignavibacteria bacterium CG_4_10_14_3_um_filter_37_18]